MRTQSGYITENPVVYLAYLRTQIILEVFKVIAYNKPKKLYLFSDGPKNESEKIILEKNRKLLLSQINWDCEVKTYFLNANLGPFKIWKHICDIVFSAEETMIYLQEDLLPSNSFFRFCDEMLLKFKDDLNIYAIGGHNYLEKYEDAQPFSYFYTPTTDALGVAFWKRTYDEFLKDYSISNNPYLRKILYERIKHRGSIHWFKHLILLSDDNYKNLIPSGEEFNIMGVNSNILYSKIAVVSSLNLIKHIGIDKASTNFSEEKLLPKSILKMQQLNTYEINFPLIDQPFKIIDYNFEKILKRKSPNLLMRFSNKLSRIIRIILFGGPKMFITKSRNRIKELQLYQIRKFLTRK